MKKSLSSFFAFCLKPGEAGSLLMWSSPIPGGVAFDSIAGSSTSSSVGPLVRNSELSPSACRVP
jgi:hypothetical protein